MQQSWNRRHRSLGAGVSRQNRERRLSTRLLDVGYREAGGKMWTLRERLGNGEDLGAVDHLAPVLAKSGHLRHRFCEESLEPGLVV